MKIPMLLLPCVLLLSTPAFAQKKGKVDPKQVKIDSLMTANSGLTMRLDSMTKEEAKYHGVYTAVKEKVLKYNYAPERASELIDSLKTAREATFSTLSADAKALNDSVATLAAQNAAMKTELDAMKAVDNEKVVADLRELKGLLDEGIITQAEFDARKAKIMQGW